MRSRGADLIDLPELLVRHRQHSVLGLNGKAAMHPILRGVTLSLDGENISDLEVSCNQNGQRP